MANNQNDQMNELGFGEKIGSVLTMGPVQAAVQEKTETIPQREGMFEEVPKPKTFDPKEDITIAREPAPLVSFLGAGVTTERNIDYDWTKATPDFSITNILPFDNEDFRSNFATSTEFVAADGQRLNVTGMDIERKIELADKFGATSIVYPADEFNPNGVEVPIPWDESITRFTKLPEMVGMGDEKGNVTIDEVNNVQFWNRLFSTTMSPDPEFGRATYAQYLNEKLIEQGLDARSRFLIINKGLKNPTLDEIQRVTGVASENIIRGTLETALWGAGELTGIGAELIGVNSPAIADFQTRGDIMDAWWEPMPYRIQEWGAENNVEIDLATAEFLAQAYTGYLPRAIGLGFEIKSGSAISNTRQLFRSQKDLKIFTEFAENQRKINPDLTDAQIMKNFTDERALKWGFFGTREKSYEGRIAQAFQISDLNLPTEQRAEVVRITTNIADLTKRREGIVKRLKENPLAPELGQRIRKIDDDIIDLEYGLIAATRRSQTPKFIRDTNIQDNYLIAGSAAFSVYFGETETFGIDAEMGELVGLGVGLSLSIAKGKIPNLYHSLSARASKDQRKKILYLGRQMQTYSPEMREIITYQAQKIDAYRNELLDLGVREDALDVTLPLITDIVTLRHLTDSLQSSISYKNAIGSAESENLQRLQRLEAELTAELNRVLVDFKPTNEAENNFLTMIDKFDEGLKQTRDEIANANNIISKKGVGHYMSNINGRTSSFEPKSLKSGESQSFDAALETLNNYNLADTSKLSETEFKVFHEEQTMYIADTLATRSNTILSELGDNESARSAAMVALAKGDELPDIPQFTSSSGLFSMHLEHRHADDLLFARRPYTIMSSPDVTYRTADGQIIDGVPTVDGYEVFNIISEVEIPGVGPFAKITRSDLDAPSKKKFDETVISLTDPFFETLATTNGKTKREVISDMKAQLESEGVSFPKGVDPQVIIAQHARENGATELFQLNPAQLREVNRTISALKHQNLENGAVYAKLNNADKYIEETLFNNFQVNGNPIGALQIQHPSIDGGAMPFGQYLKEANKGWYNYKLTWKDDVAGGIIPQLMSWGNRKNVTATRNAPGGLLYGYGSVDNFLDINRLATDEKYANNWMLSVGRAMGDKTVVPETGEVTIAFRSGKTNTMHMQTYMKTALAEYMLKNFPDMSDQQRQQFLTNLSNNVTMIDPITGKNVPMIDVPSLIDDTYSFSSKSVGKDLFDETMDVAEGRVQDAINEAIKPAKNKVKQLEDSINLIGKTFGLPANFTYEQAAQQLVSGGQNQFNTIRNTLIDSARASGYPLNVPGNAEALVDQNIADIYMLYIEKQTFKPQKKMLVSTPNGQVEVDKVSIDQDAMRAALGKTEEQKQVVRQILGDERYNMAQTMLNFVSELETNPIAGVGITGVPRGLSVESYISRIYAINRNVVSPKYVATEALLQTMRAKNYRMVTAMLNDPELGKLMLEVMRTGRPLDPVRNKRMEALLYQSITQTHTVQNPRTEKVVDAAGREYTTTFFTMPSVGKRQRVEAADVVPLDDGKLLFPSLDTRNILP